jgi:hypothetical protein
MEGFVPIPNCTVKFRGKQRGVRVGRYPATGDICLLLMDKGEVYAKASTTHPGVVLAPDEVLIKDYSENAGMVEALQSAGVIGEILREDPFPVCSLLQGVPPPPKKK